MHSDTQIDIYMDYLKAARVFNGLNENEIELFLGQNNFSIQRLSARDEVKVELDKTIIVIFGQVATFENRSDGVKSFISAFIPNQCELIAVKEDTPYSSVSVEARKPSIILLLETKSFTDVNPSLLIVQNRVQANIIQILYEMSQLVLKRTLVNAETNAKAKILKYLKQLSDEQNSTTVQIPYTRVEMADHLQIDVSTLMRELKSMKSRGMIDYDRKYIRLLDKDV